MLIRIATDKTKRTNASIAYSRQKQKNIKHQHGLQQTKQKGQMLAKFVETKPKRQMLPRFVANKTKDKCKQDLQQTRPKDKQYLHQTKAKGH